MNKIYFSSFFFFKSIPTPNKATDAMIEEDAIREPPQPFFSSDGFGLVEEEEEELSEELEESEEEEESLDPD